MDHDGPWHWSAISDSKWREIIQKLAVWEKKTWVQVLSEDPSTQHPVAIAKLIKPARTRLQELKLDDLDELFRFRLTGRERLWGVRLDNVFYSLWWDPKHEICPSNKRHT